MDIIYKVGDITRASERYIIHGCNAQGRMGSGVAKALMDRYPEVREEYIKAHAEWPSGSPFLGTIHVVHTDDHVIFNAITQEFYGYDGALYASYDAIEQCMTKLNAAMALLAQSTGEVQHVAMPVIGCGLAGGSWDIVEAIIEKCSTDFQPVVYTLTGAQTGV